MKFDTSDMVGVLKNVVVMALVAIVLTGSFLHAGILAVVELVLHVLVVQPRTPPAQGPAPPAQGPAPPAQRPPAPPAQRPPAQNPPAQNPPAPNPPGRNSNKRGGGGGNGNGGAKVVIEIVQPAVPTAKPRKTSGPTPGPVTFAPTRGPTFAPTRGPTFAPPAPLSSLAASPRPAASLTARAR